MKQSFDRVSDLNDVETVRPTYLAIGTFDGVHLGHQKLLSTMVQAARAEGARPAAMTFHPHPGTVIRGRSGRLYLSTLDERVAMLAEQGIELVITHPFDDQVRQTRARDFVRGLSEKLGLGQLWGGSFGLGYNREGDLPFLQRAGREMGFEVHLFEAMVEWNGAIVSSSRVRRGLANGDMSDVAGCLGRAYRVSGRVGWGDQRGRTIGVPTANLEVWEEQLLPENGVYATFAWLGGQKYVAATNVGVRPTVDGKRLMVEAHLLDFDEDIYGEELTLEFIARIRPERRFDGLEALVSQIRDDVAQVRERLAPAVA